MLDYEIFDLGDCVLKSGATLRNAKLAYNEYEIKHMPNAEFRPIPSLWGHFAGGGINPVDTKFIDDSLKELLAS